jgi:hypothetical protein
MAPPSLGGGCRRGKEAPLPPLFERRAARARPHQDTGGKPQRRARSLVPRAPTTRERARELLNGPTRFTCASRFAIEFRGAGGGACQAGAVDLLAALSRWAGAEPGERGGWPGVARIAGCPSSCVPALAELCPNVASVELAAWDAGGVLLPGALRALPALSRLTELRINGRPRQRHARDLRCRPGNVEQAHVAAALGA